MCEAWSGASLLSQGPPELAKTSALSPKQVAPLGRCQAAGENKAGPGRRPLQGHLGRVLTRHEAQGEEGVCSLNYHNSSRKWGHDTPRYTGQQAEAAGLRCERVKEAGGHQALAAHSRLPSVAPGEKPPR